MTSDQRFLIGLALASLVAMLSIGVWLGRDSPVAPANRAAVAVARPSSAPSPPSAPEPPSGAAVSVRTPEPLQSDANEETAPPSIPRAREQDPPAFPAAEAPPEPAAAAREERPSAAAAEPELSAPDDAPLATPLAPRSARALNAPLLRRWSQPGLCNEPGDAAAARETLAARFRVFPWGDSARIFVDPRLSDGAPAALPGYLELAERDIELTLGLHAPRPDVFAYADAELLLAAACTNDKVVAYYDGALHVVMTDADVTDSVMHEYTHHVLMNNGMLGPTWAQEGLAMHQARETWWLSSDWLTQLLTHPLPMEAMEESIPYTLSSEQAVLFYAQAAAMVSCMTPSGGAGLRSVLSAFATARPGLPGELAYDLPPELERAAWRACLERLRR